MQIWMHLKLKLTENSTEKPLGHELFYQLCNKMSSGEISILYSFTIRLAVN
jgi:hypothetical protein